MLLATASSAADRTPAPDGHFDPAVAWQSYLATGDSNKTVAAYHVVFDVLADGGDVDVGKCRKNLSRFDDVIRDVPVGVGLWYYGYLCAKAIGDEPDEERYSQGFEKLATFALAKASDDMAAAPIRVTHAVDIDALTAATGMQVVYRSYDLVQPGRYMPIRVVLWDSEKGRERHLRFDMLDTLAQISRDPASAGAPGLRLYLNKAFVGQQVADNNLIGVDLRAAIDAANADGLADKLAKLRPAAERGGIRALRQWLEVCLQNPGAECGGGLVDALIPLAEKHESIPMVLLATAYFEGVGVDRDAKAAMTLLDAADKRFGKFDASVAFAELYLQRHDLPFPQELQERLSRAKAAGNPAPDQFLLRAKINDKNHPRLSADELAILEAQAKQGLVTPLSMLFDYYDAQKDDSAALAWLRRAADAGVPEDQAELAYHLYDGKKPAKDQPEAVGWMRLAADGGNNFAIRFMAATRKDANDPKGVEAWLTAGAMNNDTRSLLQLAEFYLEDPPGVSGDSKRGVQLLETLATSLDSVEAGRELAILKVDGTKTAKDLDGARKLLAKNAEGGDGDSQVVLGAFLLDGKLGAVDEAKGLAWLQKAIDAGNASAPSALGYWLYYTKHTNESRARALAIWRKALKGNLEVANNLAWALCTSPNPTAADAGEGLQIAKGMGDPEDIFVSVADTVGSCYATAGQYPQAARIQARVVERLSTADPKNASLKEMRARLALYESGKRYVDPADVAPTP
jgi:TPR repeat protein